MQSLNAETLSGALGVKISNFDPAGHAGTLATL
jgi:hypothetical protein